MTFNTIVIIILNLFPLSEIVLAVRKRAASGGATTIEDRGSLKLIWLVILTAISLAIAAVFFTRFPLPLSRLQIEAATFLLVAAGMGLRWLSIATLGSRFTVNVAIVAGHALIEKGPYRWIRHPSYTGLLIAFLGAGLYLDNMVALVVLMVPICGVLIWRIMVEEEVLERNFGAEYAAYRRRTKRLIPFVW